MAAFVNIIHLILLQAGIKGLPAWVKFNIPMRARFLLEPADKPGSAEKIFRIIEEWGGSPLLSEASVKPSYLGLVHRNLRRFTGSMILWPAKKGFI